MDKNLLRCTLPAPGTPFTVKETLKDSTFMPGTCGFVSLLNGPDYTLHNIGFLQVVTLRKGKKGKPRLNTNNILVPLFQLPGDIYLEKLIPIADELKYLVDIETKENLAMSIGHKSVNTNEYLGWLLSRTQFAFELSKVTYPGDNKIMRKLGINGGAQMRAWYPKNSLLENFRREVEPRFNDGQIDRLEKKYCTPEAKVELLTELRRIESRLIIPRLEYQRRVHEVLTEALKMTETVVKEAAELENKDDITKKIKATKEWIKTNGNTVKTAIDRRLGLLVKNRKVLEF